MTDHQPAIVSAGEALVDFVPDPVPGGGPMNVAIAAARLGARSAFAGGISTDEHGVTIWDHLLANGVDLSLCERTDAPTARAIVEHVPELRFRFEGGNTADTLLSDLPLDTLGAGPHILHGGTLGMFRGPTAETLARAVENHDGIVSLDPNIRPQIIDDRAEWDHFHQRWLTGTHIYKGSDEDLDWIWPGRTPESCAEELLAGDVRVAMITRGGEGLSILTAHGASTAVAPEVEVVDTVGAGDTIVGTVLASLWEWQIYTADALATVTSDHWQTIARRAVGAAAVTVSRAGADVPTRDDLGDLWG